MIRLSEKKDLDRILELYDSGRARMRAAGNSIQWVNGYPSADNVLQDIQNGTGFVMEENGTVCAAFAFIVGPDPTYTEIDRMYPEDLPYGTIHRIASDGIRHGVLQECLDYCLTVIPRVRVDTHADNAVMRRAIQKAGFSECGVTFLSDGTPRTVFRIAKSD